MNGASQPQRERIPELDGLRGLAILLVIICHYFANSEHAQLGFFWHHFFSALTACWSGVDLFFILSGFLIGGILLGSRQSPRYFSTFYMRRVHRILPVYYGWILLYVLIFGGIRLLTPNSGIVNATDLLPVPYYALFLQNSFGGFTPLEWKWFAVTWSLAVEEQFYLFAPLLVRWISESRLIILIVGTTILAPLLRLIIFVFFPAHSFLAMFAMPARADALSLGILAAIFWRRREFRAYLQEHPALLQRCLAGLFAGLLVLLWWLDHPLNIVTATIGYSWLALFYLCLLLVVLTQTTGWIAGVMRTHALRYLGTISYCVYLIHFTIHQWGHHLLLHSKPRIYDWKGVGATFLSLLVTIVLASLSWRFFEKPFLKRGHSYTY